MTNLLQPIRPRLLAALTAALALGILAFAWQRIPWPVQPVEQTGELIIVTRNSPSTWYEDATGKDIGIEHDLAELFAREIGVKVRFLIVNSTQEMMNALEQHRAHIAAGLAITSDREKRFNFSVPYQSVEQELVCNADATKPKTPADLAGKTVEVATDGGRTELMRSLAHKWPHVAWLATPTLEPEEILSRVAEGRIACAVANSNVVSIERNFEPNIEVAMDVGDPLNLAWAFPREADPWLFNRSQEFFSRIEQDGTLKHLEDRYYGHVDRLERADIVSFMSKITSILPRLKSLFMEAQKETGIDWRLLAALGYQESHWDAQATSPTGVRGLMMLTEDTATELKVTDRLDPHQIIPAGAKYLLSLRDQLPDSVRQPDRDWMALAAYNIGLGHLQDAMQLARRHHLNPNSWTDIKRVLPQLALSSVASRLAHGFARGGEAVIFVENIRTYYDILAHQSVTGGFLAYGS